MKPQPVRPGTRFYALSVWWVTVSRGWGPKWWCVREDKARQGEFTVKEIKAAIERHADKPQTAPRGREVSNA